MLLIFGSRLDDQPWLLAEHLARFDVSPAIVIPFDLSRPGWRLRTGRAGELQAATADRVIGSGQIAAVVNLLPWITVHDLPHIAEDDREYVANEMAAFLLGWLCELDCPMIDRPTSLSLAGCGRWPSEWAALAMRVGVRADTQWQGPRVDVTVLGGCAVAEPGGDGRLARAAEAVAHAARRSLVTLHFAQDDHEPIFVGAAARPMAGTPAVADALRAWLPR